MPAFSITDAVRDRKLQAGPTWLGHDQGKIPTSTYADALGKLRLRHPAPQPSDTDVAPEPFKGDLHHRRLLFAAW